MYGENIERYLKEEEKPEEYDFKNECNKSAEHAKSNKNDLLTVLHYRTYKGVHADSCYLAYEVYKKLGFGKWGQWVEDRNYPRWGGDAMTSFFTIFNYAFKTCCPNEFPIYQRSNNHKWLDPNKLLADHKWIDAFSNDKKSEDILSQLKILARLTHSIGNYIMVPSCGFIFKEGKKAESFNTGRYIRVYDFWDSSLKLMQDADPNMFGVFIEKGFLKDIYFSEKIGGVIDLIESTDKDIVLLKDSQARWPVEEQLENYLKNVNNKILARGKRMVDELKDLCGLKYIKNSAGLSGSSLFGSNNSLSSSFDSSSAFITMSL